MPKKSFLVTELVEVTFEIQAIVTSTGSVTVLFRHPLFLESSTQFYSYPK